MPIRTTLFKKYALIFSVLIGGSLFISGLLSINYSYQENKQALIKLQREKAEAAASRIGQYLFDIEQKISLTAVTKHDRSALDQRGLEIQLLRRTPAIDTISLLDQKGKEHLRLERRNVDSLESAVDFSAAAFFQEAQTGRRYRSPVYFREGGLFMTTAMAVGPEAAGITVAEIDLEFLLAGISRIKVGESGHAYAVDADGRLIAHPDIGMVLRNTSLAKLPQVQAAIKNPTQTDQVVLDAHDLNGEAVLTAFGSIPQLGWFVFVEEPLAEAYKPLYTQVVRSALLVVLGLLLTLLATVALVRRMTKPIHVLQKGAALIGSGSLHHRISITTGDELEELANEFNRMAERLQDSYSTLERKVDERTRELAESNGKLAALSSTDALTGIANRRRFDEVLANEWSRAARSGQSLALGMLDIDWFKIYNDHYGHQAGDACLRRVANVIASNISRTGDLVARYGGEEFVFIAPGTDADGVLSMAQKLCEAIQAEALPHEFSRFGCITASIGVAALVPDDECSAELLVKAADVAMYQAKDQGRNLAVFRDCKKLDEFCRSNPTCGN